MFKTLERLAGEKFHDNLNEILSLAGFDSKTAIKSLSKPQNIVNIEKYINENRKKFENILKGTKYEHLQPFSFLPGHLALLSGLPDYLVDLETKKRKGVKTTEKKLLITDDVETKTYPGKIDQTEDELIPETITDENLPDTKTIQQLFLAKIKTYSERKNILVEISDENILNFRQEGGEFKCVVQCSVCSKKISCKYLKNWIWPNLQSHLKSHLQSTFELYEIDADNTVNKLDQRNAPESIVRLIDKNDSSMNSILNVM